MAQAKTKTKTKPKSTPKRRSAGSKASKSNSRSRASKPTPTIVVSKAADKATHTVGSATHTVGSAAKKATVPLVAGGAAIVGAAGGMALGARQARRSNSRHNLAKAARGVGTLGTQMGRLASEIHQARESGNGKHRSPVEVVLEGLTARRSRA